MLRAMEDTDTLFGAAIAALLQSTSDPFFLQIGGFDGVSFDPLRPQIVKHRLRGLIVEPIPQNYEKLAALYRGSETVMTANYAVAEADETRSIWRFKPQAVERGLLAPHFAGISSFVMDELLSEQGMVGRSAADAQTKQALKLLVEPVPVRCRTMDSLLREFGVDWVDILQIDTEGYDLRILQMFDFDRFRPAVVHYEHQHLTQDQRRTAAGLLHAKGYHFYFGVNNTLAVLPTPYTRIVFKDSESVRRHVRALSTDMRALEAMRTLADFIADGGAGDFSGEIRDLKHQAFVFFNKHIAAGEVLQAELYISALAAFLPGQLLILEKAFECNRVLGRIGRATDFAIGILRVDPNFKLARDFIVELRKLPQTAEIEVSRRMARAFSQRADVPGVQRLSELEGAAGAILSARLDAHRIAQLGHIQELAATIQLPFAAGSESARWVKLYRRMIEAIDLPALKRPEPPAPPEYPAMFSMANGALDWPGVRTVARHFGARVVFFAAADQRYVERYAKWYASTILAACDVPCLIIIHVIGAGANLHDIAATVGVKDGRLILSGDDFNAADVKNAVIDSPDYPPRTSPVAHFQSVRFMRLPGLLQNLGLPVLVSDIDTLLLRGISDLLAAHADEDVVINENVYGLSVADRLTANLLLVAPTASGVLFARFLADYLVRHLAAPEVVRWIDQIGLLLARHYLRRLPGARDGLFDTKTDINNVMFPRYGQNPYRFLSLYQDFDMKSLEGLVTLKKI